MPLDFHRSDTNELLFGLDNTDYTFLYEIFESFTQWTGLIIDQYKDMILTTENQEALVKIINKYIDSTDLNKDKKKTSAILEFKGIIQICINKKIDLQLLGD